MGTLCHDGLAFSYTDAGSGPPFVFQHGLGGDARQPASQAPGGCRLITLECRGHGGTPLGPEESLGFETFARDLEALLNWLGLPRVVLGGVSMGAGVALALAWLRPERVSALVLVRPAWIDRRRPRNLGVYTEIASLLGAHGPEAGKTLFEHHSVAYRRARQRSPALAGSLTAQFDRPHARERCRVLERLPADRPIGPDADWSRLDMPALVIGARGDDVHPYRIATALQERLPRAEVHEAPSKDHGDAEHRQAIAAAIGSFLARIGRAVPAPTGHR